MFVENNRLIVCKHQVDFYKRQVVWRKMSGQKKTVTGAPVIVFILSLRMFILIQQHPKFG